MFSRRALKGLIRYLPPYKFIQLSGIKSKTGEEIDGFGIVCPLLPEQMVGSNEQFAIKKVSECVKLAARLGADIVGLGGFTSIIGEGGEVVARDAGIAVTSGNTYTASLAIEGVLKAAALTGINLKEAVVLIVGATGDIGSICTKVLARRIPRLILAARNDQRLSEFADKIRQETGASVEIAKYIETVVPRADIILSVTSALSTIIEPEKLKSGAIVCDVSYPANISMELAAKRQDVLVFEGGLAKSDCLSGIGRREKLDHFNPSCGAIHGCFSETIILGLEGKFTNFSLGRGNITEEKVSEISALAAKHGFSLSNFCAGSRVLGAEDITRIAANKN